MTLNASSKARLEQAVATAEARTGAEIVCMVMKEAANHLWIERLVAALIALAIPGFLLMIDQLSAWTIWLLQLAAFVGLATTLPFFKVGHLIVGAERRRADSRQMAEAQFFSHGLRNTSDRAAVLIFVALAERGIEILVDDAAAEKIPDAEWEKISAAISKSMKHGALEQGLVSAITMSADLLAAHFPPRANTSNQLQDVIFE